MRITKRQQQTLLVLAGLILLYSLEALMITKDADQLDHWLSLGNTFDGFILMNMMQYALHVFMPVIYGIVNLFRNRTKEGVVFRGVFTVLLAMAMVFRIGERQFVSPFFYMSILLYLLLIVLLHKE